MIDAAIPELSTPRAAIAALAAKNQIGLQAAYEAASQTPRLQSWRPSTVSPNAIISSLATLRDRSRSSTRNDGYASAGIGTLAANFVGDGIKPLSQIKDAVLRAEIQAAWNEWVQESDADGLLDFYGQQTQIVRTWLEAGEGYARIRQRYLTDDLTVPLQVQNLEPELSPYTYDGFAKNGNRIRAGIEFDAIGHRVAYYFHPSRPELDDFDASTLKRADGAFVCHVFDPLRPTQLRGVPLLTQVLIKLRDLDIYDDATLLRQQIQNLFAVFVTREAGLGEDDYLDPLTGKPVADPSRPAVALKPGIVQELMPGEDVKFSSPPTPDGGYAEFNRQQLRKISVGMNLPYELLTGDMSGMNDRTIRVVMNNFKRHVGMKQHQIIAFKYCQPIWNAWMNQGALTNTLPLPKDYANDPRKYQAVKWTPPRWAYLHPVQDVEADQAAILAGFASRSEIVSEYGEDAETVDAEQAADNARADRLGLKYASDSRFVVVKKAAAGSENLTPGESVGATA